MVQPAHSHERAAPAAISGFGSLDRRPRFLGERAEHPGSTRSRRSPTPKNRAPNAKFAYCCNSRKTSCQLRGPAFVTTDNEHRLAAFQVSTCAGLRGARDPAGAKQKRGARSERRALRAMGKEGLSLVAAEENLQRWSNGRYGGERYRRAYVLPRRRGGNDLRYRWRYGEKMKIDGLACTVGIHAMRETNALTEKYAITILSRVVAVKQVDCHRLGQRARLGRDHRLSEKQKARHEQGDVLYRSSLKDSKHLSSDRNPFRGFN